MLNLLTQVVLSLAIAISSPFAALVQKLNAQAPIDPSAITGEFDSNDLQASFHGDILSSPSLASTPTPKNVLGDSSQGKRIEVDLTTQHLYAFEGDKKVYDFVISSGKWGRTPTGIFQIWGKFRYTKMSGGSQALRTYYYLPNVPFVMFFENDEIAASRGFSLHGTYWHSNFGHPMSHGCINMRTEDAGVIFNWSEPNSGNLKTSRATQENPGTTVVIYGQAPKE